MHMACRIILSDDYTEMSSEEGNYELGEEDEVEQLSVSAEEETYPESGPSTPERERYSPSGGEALAWAAWTASCLGVGAVCGRRLPRRPTTGASSLEDLSTPRRPTAGASRLEELPAPEAKTARASRGQVRLAGYAAK